jgi:hypothetical protein
MRLFGGTLSRSPHQRLLVPTLSLARGCPVVVTPAALPAATPNAKVAPLVLVALRALGSGYLGLNPWDAPDVLSLSHWLQVLDCHTVPVYAPLSFHMIDLVALRNRPHLALPGRSVCIAI